MSAPARNPGRPITAARPVPDFRFAHPATKMPPSTFADVVGIDDIYGIYGIYGVASDR
jgi:hypothetical protein